MPSSSRCAIGVIVLLVTALLVNTAPPRWKGRREHPERHDAVPAGQAGRLSATLSNGGIQFDIKLSPG